MFLEKIDKEYQEDIHVCTLDDCVAKCEHMKEFIPTGSNIVDVCGWMDGSVQEANSVVDCPYRRNVNVTICFNKIKKE